jgi:hypothetical protein
MRRHALACAALAALVAVVVAAVAPAGGDQAAHFYGRHVFRQDGLSLWDNYWYSGHPSFITYSLVYYPLAAWFGTWSVAIVSVAAASFAYATVVLREWRGAAVLSAYVFAVVWGATVSAGAYPFLLGAAFGLLALHSAQLGAAGRFAALALLTMATNPVAFVLIAIIVVAVVLASSGFGGPTVRHPGAHMVWIAVTLLLVTVAELVVWRVFRSGGRYPYSRAALLYVLACCLAGAGLSWRLERARVLFTLFVVYGVAALAAFALPSPLGANVTRLRLAALPIGVIVLTLRRWRPVTACVAALALVGWWTLQPTIGVLVQTGVRPSARASYWAPTVTFLKRNMTPDYRAHVVDTVGHWGAAYLPGAGIPIARGWFRQHDYPRNSLFYDGTLTPDRYLAWLHQASVRYVVLSSVPVDYSSSAEKALLTTGRAGLTVAARLPQATVFAVPSPVGIVSGPAYPYVSRFTRSQVTVVLQTAGSYVISVRHSPHWHTRAGCLVAGPGQLMTLRVARPGAYPIDFHLSGHSLLRALEGRESANDASCVATPIPAP